MAVGRPFARNNRMGNFYGRSFLSAVATLLILGCSNILESKDQPFSLEYLSTLFDRVNLRIEVSGLQPVEYSYDIAGGMVHRSDTNTIQNCIPGPVTLGLLEDFVTYMNALTPQNCGMIQLSKYYFSYEKDGVVSTTGCPVYLNADKDRIENLSNQLWLRCAQ